MDTDLRNPKRVWSIGFACLLVFLVFSICWGSSEHPIGMAFSVAPLFGMVAFLIASAFARRCRRPLTIVDGIRIGCWTALGCAEGVREMSTAYYEHYWPQYSVLAHMSAVVTMTTCLLIIVTVTVLYPRAFSIQL